MKSKIQSLILLVLCLIISACSSDDDGNTSLSPEGEWLITSLLIESSFDFDEDGTASRDMFQETNCYNGNSIQFFDNGDVIIDVDLAYIFIDDNNQHDVECQNGFGLTSTWTQNGNTITVVNDFNDDNLVGTISGNTITLTIEDGFEVEFYDAVNDDVIIMDEDFTIIFTKM
ncbi:hypothetical protein [uncultured Winogradskyella sp.]|uniref:hypothetical protein n=1 Tax=uncultured Winogradskyella sp. TaxID=395353 RepID=UPI002614B1B5|nr:hypothetical protein [uncultured Winogradskyella sp.]